MQGIKHEIFASILAGGSGTRFWPRSRQSSPKQLCKITDPKHTMLEETLKRLDGFIEKEHRIIVTHHVQSAKTKELVAPQVQNILAEPLAKNTAAAIALAVLDISQLSKDQDPIMVSLHSDHLIKDEGRFHRTLEKAIETAQKGYLTLIGIPPTHPETGFGYIHRGEELSKESFEVQSFKEKPDYQTAKHFFESGEYYWNSGIFVWSLKSIISAFEKYLPEIWNPLKAFHDELPKEGKTLSTVPLEALEKIYKTLPEISIDDGILEKANNCAVVPSEFEWNDVGSWTALSEVFAQDESGNLIQGEGLALKTENSILTSDGPFVTSYGVKDLLIIAEKDCVLVCPKKEAQGIKEVVAKLKEMGREDLLC